MTTGTVGCLANITTPNILANFTTTTPVSAGLQAILSNTIYPSSAYASVPSPDPEEESEPEPGSQDLRDVSVPLPITVPPPSGGTPPPAGQTYLEVIYVVQRLFGSAMK